MRLWEVTMWRKSRSDQMPLQLSYEHAETAIEAVEASANRLRAMHALNCDVAAIDVRELVPQNPGQSP